MSDRIQYIEVEDFVGGNENQYTRSIGLGVSRYMFA
jgi:hypothetical protein